MTLVPGYGETPLDGDELDALLPAVRELLGDSLTKADVYDLEQAVQGQVTEDLLPQVLQGDPALEELISDHFVRELHQRLYGDIWNWGGRTRRRELNLGVAPERIDEELRASLDTIRYRWENTSDWTARELGVAVHADVVRIHPFVDGNGRATRLQADLVFVAAQDGDTLLQYDWQLNKPDYIALLQEYDASRDVRQLAAFIPVRVVDP